MCWVSNSNGCNVQKRHCNLFARFLLAAGLDFESAVSEASSSYSLPSIATTHASLPPGAALLHPMHSSAAAAGRRWPNSLTPILTPTDSGTLPSEDGA